MADLAGGNGSSAGGLGGGPGAGVPALDPVSTPAPVSSVPSVPSQSQSSPAMGAGAGGSAGGGGASPALGQAGAGSGQSGSASLRDALASRGIDTAGFGSDDELVDAFASQAERFGEVQQLAQYGARYVDHAADFERWREQQAQEAAAAQQKQQVQQQPKDPWAPPPWDESWLKVVGWDEESQRYLPKRFEDASVAKQVNEYHRYTQRVQQELQRNPQKFLQDLTAPILQKQFDERMAAWQQQQQQAAQQQAAEQQAARVIAENARDWFQHDAAGNMVLDRAGAPVMTRHGQAVEYYAAEARRNGVVNSEFVTRYATESAARDMAIFAWQEQQAASGQVPAGQVPPAGQAPAAGQTSQQVPRAPNGQFVSATPQQQNEQLKQTFLQKVTSGGYSPNRDATVASAAEAGMPQNSEDDFGAIARQTMRARGLLPQHG